jgi:hypothetical protein
MWLSLRDELLKSTVVVGLVSLFHGHLPTAGDATIDIASGAIIGLGYHNRHRLTLPHAPEPLYYEGQVLSRNMVKLVV